MLDQMVSLDSIKVPEGYTKDAVRLSYYFGKFKFKITAEIPNIHYFRSALTVDAIPSILRIRPYRGRNNTSKSIGDMTSLHITCIHGFVEWREQLAANKDHVRIILTYDKAVVYTNDAALADSFVQAVTVPPVFKPEIQREYATQVQDYNKHVIYHKDPKFKYRIFLKHRKHDIDSLKRFIVHINENGFSASRQLSKILAKLDLSFNNTFWLWSGLYLDHNDDTAITAFALTHSEFIDKVVRIEKVKP